MLAEMTSGATGWNASLDLHFTRAYSRTILARRRHRGPLVVQRPFYPEDDVCHAYVVHPPGGVVAGDCLSLDVTVDEGAGALLTTPAAGKFYRSDGPRAVQVQRLDVAGTLEWLPQENIVFDGARVSTATRVELAAGARFIGWDITCLGRPAADERYTCGAFGQTLEIWREDVPLLLERGWLNGPGPVTSASWGLQGEPVMGTMVAVSAAASDLDAVRAGLGGAHGRSFTATLVDDVLVCRYLGGSTRDAREAFARAWGALRPGLMGRDACLPRIWRT